VPLVLVLAATAQLWLRLADVTRASVPRVAVSGVAAAAVVALSVDAVTMRELAMAQQPKLGLPAIVSSLRANPARAGRPVEFVLDEHDTWPAAAGVAVESARTGMSWCIRNGFGGLWSVLFDSSNVCPSTNASSRWQLHFSVNAPLPADAHVLDVIHEGRTQVTIYDVPGQPSKP
jgi:hypothetical protein